MMTKRQRPPKAQPLYILDMLDGNDWRHLILTYAAAQKLIQHTRHRGYTLEPYDNR